MTQLLLPLLWLLLMPSGSAAVSYDLNYIETFTPDSFLNVRFLRNAGKFPYLIKFYNPSCSHCRGLIPEFNHVAKYLAINKINFSLQIKTAIVNCEHYPALCSASYPKFELFNLRENGELDARLEYHVRMGFHNLVLPFLKKTFHDQLGLPVSAWPGAPDDDAKAVDTRTKDTSSETDRIVDAAAAFVGGLPYFAAKDTIKLSHDELDALKEWVRIASLAFPGAVNRWVIRDLYEEVQRRSDLTSAEFRQIVEDWQGKSVKMYEKYGHPYQNTEIPLPLDLFSRDGSTFRVCFDRNCGTWWLFHLLTVNFNWLGHEEDVFYAIRGFIQHFFHCTPCKNHFLQANPVAKGEEIAATTKSKKHDSLILWLYQTHNDVNQRLHNETWPDTEPEDPAQLLHIQYGFTDTPDITWLTLFQQEFGMMS